MNARTWIAAARPRDRAAYDLDRRELKGALEHRAAWETDFWRQTLSSLRADKLLSDAGY